MLATAAAIRCTVAAWPLAARGRPGYAAAPLRNADDARQAREGEAPAAPPPQARPAEEPH
ncbi:hypothetical protein [Pseudomonas sp. CGJS7]|uniref:hypothetical protein n=1 Tax=Pseudomonas sp. CGJS7 TaxID=3109348 RepID=UPI0030083DEA